MNHRSKIPALALLGLSFTHCTGRDSPGDPIVGDWRAIQVDGDKHPVPDRWESDLMRGEQLRIEADHGGEMALYAERSVDGYIELSEQVAELVVDASEAPRYRIEVAHDFFGEGGDYGYPGTSAPGTGYDDSGYDDSGAPDPTGQGDSGELQPARLRPLTVPTRPGLAPAAMVFDCTLDEDTLTCDREDADEHKHWVFARIEPDDP